MSSFYPFTVTHTHTLSRFLLCLEVKTMHRHVTKKQQYSCHAKTLSENLNSTDTGESTQNAKNLLMENILYQLHIFLFVHVERLPYKALCKMLL